jgi:hypothetical protein
MMTAIARGVIISHSIITIRVIMDGEATGAIPITIRFMIRGTIHGIVHGTSLHTTIHICISRTIHIMVTTVIMATTDTRIVFIIAAMEQLAERAPLAARAAAE